MKIAVICDSHHGARNDSKRFADYFSRFYREVFFPYLDQHKIGTVWHLGDLVDRRKFVNFTTARRLREDLLDPLDRRGVRTMILAGNHDVFFKTTNEVNALRELVQGRYQRTSVRTSPGVVTVPGAGKVLALPWVCDANSRETMALVDEAECALCVGHLEFSGFSPYRGSVMERGMSPAPFQKFEKVLSGHYHHRSTSGPVHYLGAPYEMCWQDHDDERGFHVLDTDTLALEYVRNPLTIHEKLWYSDDGMVDLDFSQYEDKIVRLIVKSREDTLRFDKFVRELDRANCDVQVVDDHLHMDVLDDGVTVEEAGDTLDVLVRYVEGLPEDVDKPALDRLLRDVYKEAIDRHV